MEKVNERQPFSEIPSALLWEILGRVPNKTCLTCKLVCKEWYHIVVNREFSYFHRHRKASSFALLFHNVWSDGEGLVFNLVEIDKELDVDGSRKCVVGVDRMITVHPKIDTSNDICTTWGEEGKSKECYCGEKKAAADQFAVIAAAGRRPPFIFFVDTIRLICSIIEMQNVKQHQPFSEIPSVILWEILGRVPIKTCLACKLVCKEWYHIVVTPEFSSFRLRCNASRFTTILFYNGWVSGGGGVDFHMVEFEKALDVDDSDNDVGVDDLSIIKVLQKFGAPGQRLHVSSQCNGVVCLENNNDDYFVCNLLTSQCVNVLNVHQLKKQYEIISCELGCCPTSGQFKVLIMLWDTAKKIQLAKIQTLGNGEWRNVDNVPLRMLSGGGCYLNGSSHWCGRTYIWVFHFGTEMFMRMPIPDNITSANYTKQTKKLSVLDSCLCLRCFSQSPDKSHGIVEMDIWIMKKYGVKSSWVRQVVIVTKAMSVPMVHMDKGKILVRTGVKLNLYDPQTQVSKVVKYELNRVCSYLVPFAAFDARFSRF
ncbi:unnamed protein product [Cuscuta campestris]|uniref:F-box domain-containing protein n=1 Tax=Cuscuta campestris TaxID=132261 RepID=A0A484MF02_9ASTE|nr:unnamed protein product [Cuscuta campestris]